MDKNTRFLMAQEAGLMTAVLGSATLAFDKAANFLNNADFNILAGAANILTTGGAMTTVLVASMMVYDLYAGTRESIREARSKRHPKP